MVNHTRNTLIDDWRQSVHGCLALVMHMYESLHKYRHYGLWFCNVFYHSWPTYNIQCQKKLVIWATYKRCYITGSTKKWSTKKKVQSNRVCATYLDWGKQHLHQATLFSCTWLREEVTSSKWLERLVLQGAMLPWNWTDRIFHGMLRLVM